MPTENRSRNPAMVSVPRHLVLDAITFAWDHDANGNVAALQNWLDQPAPQPHPDPIAWMVGTAFWWTKEEAERDAADTGLPIVGLGPMAPAAPAQQHQGEPVMRLECEKLWGGAGEYAVDFVKPGWLQECRQKGGTFLLYTHPAPADPNVRWKAVADEQMEVIAGLKAEVERLRAELKELRDSMAYRSSLLGRLEQERDTLRDQLNALEELAKEEAGEVERLRAELAEAQALLRKIGGYNWANVDPEERARTRAELRDMLSASAEPSALTWACQLCQLEQPTDRPCDVCGGKTEPVATKP